MTDKLHLLTIKQLKNLIASKKISINEVYNYFSARIKKYNPVLNAVLTECNVMSDVNSNSIFYGIPFSAKDAYITDGVRTTVGSNVLKDYVSKGYQATVISKLLSNGARLVAKTNQDPWGHGGSTENSDFGSVKNPWDISRTPGGSSGGSAVSVAAGFAMFDIAEDTGGSIRLPAAFTGTVGLKPSYGRVSRYGAIAYASSLDTVGPIAKTVEDCALVLEYIAGYDVYDATSVKHKVPKYTNHLQNDISGLKIGLPKEYFVGELDSTIQSTIRQAVKVLEKLGVTIKEISLPMTKYAIATYYLIAMSETSSNLTRFDGIRFGDRTKMGSEQKRRIMLGTYTLSAGYYDQYYKKATKVRRLIKQDFDNAFKEVDVILAPVAPTPPFKLGTKIKDPLQMYLFDIFTVPASLAHLPSLALPAGYTKDDLPIGMQLIGPYLSEALLLNIGYKYEQAIRGFKVLDDSKLEDLVKNG